MALLNYMQKNKFGVYEYKRRIPKDLLDKFSQYQTGFIKFSLKTKDANDAKRLKQQQDAIHEAMFEEARGVSSSQNIPSAKRAPQLSSAKLSQPKTGKYLDDLESLWKQERGKAPKTIEAMHRMVEQFQELYGKVDIAHITKAHVHEFRGHLAAIISKRETSSDTLSVSTINKYLTNLGVLLNIAISHDLLSVNPTKGLKLRKSVKEKAEKRQPFDSNDLETLFYKTFYESGDGRAFTKDYEGNVGQNSRYWLPLLALYTGARLEELAQLTVKDIKNEFGITYFDINANDDKNIKTVGSIRKVPIHNELIRLGFIDYVASVGAAKHEHLFPDLRGYKGVRSHYFSKWFGEHKRKLGINSELKVFYSFRHTFIDAARNSEISRAVSQSLTGHAGENVGDGYGKGFSLKALNEQLQKLQAPISFKKYHIKTSQLLNPQSDEFIKSAPIVLPALPTLAEVRPITEDPRTFITLADVYHRMGKALYGDDWKDYEIVDILASKYVKVDLNQFLRKDHNLAGQQELRAIKSRDTLKLRYKEVTQIDKEWHARILNLFLKDMHYADIECYSKLEAGQSKCPAPEFWGNDDYELSTIFSTLKCRADGTRWHLVFSSKGIQQSIKFYNQVAGANKNPKGGRNVSIPWDKIDVLLMELYTSATPPRSYSACYEILNRLIRDNPDKCQQQGIPIDDLIPSASAIKKRMKKLRP